MLNRPVLQISYNIVNHTLSMGCMKSVIQCVGVIINTNVLSVYSMHARGSVNARGTMHTCRHAPQNIRFFVKRVHVIALCTLHDAFLGYHTINEEDKCSCSTSSSAHAVYST